MSILDKIERPTLLLDKIRCINNIDSMLVRVSKAGSSLRPHFKTPQSLKIGHWFKERGVEKITVSSLQMAAYFAAAGWTDITVAFPINIREASLINRLAGQIQLNILLESTAAIEALNIFLEHPLNAFVKIDLGTGRSGIVSDDFEKIEVLLDMLETSDKINFAGFLAHAGHSYAARGVAEVLAVQASSIRQMTKLKSRYQHRFPNLQLSLGDTPCCSLATEWPDIDELRPGNFVFYDLMQWQIGACSLDQIAVALACPVVAKHPERLELVLYGGGVHLSKDRLELNGNTVFGLVSALHEQNWELPDSNNYLRSLSQEHGIAKVTASFMNEVKVGDLVAVLPVHSCMTADLMRAYMDFEGEFYDHV